MTIIDEADRFPLKTCLVAIVVVAGGSFQLGYQVSCLNPSQEVFKRFMNESTYQHYGVYISKTAYRILWPAFINIQLIGRFLTICLFVRITEALGRKGAFCVITGFCFTGIAVQAFSKMATSFEMLTAGRIITGVGNGLIMGLEPMYFNEISPIAWRGTFCSISGIAIEFGAFIGSIAAWSEIFGTDYSWPALFAVNLIPISCLLWFLPFLKESPRYLLSQNKVDKAKETLAYFGFRDVDNQIKLIEHDRCSKRGVVTFKEIFDKDYLRKAMLLSLTVVVAYCAGGMVALDSFSTHILQGVGVRPNVARYATSGIFFCTFVGALVAGIVTDKVGRRPLLLCSSLAVLLVNVTLMVSRLTYDTYGYTWLGYVSIGACFTLTLSFGFGLSVMQWTATSELMPQNARPTALLIQMFFMRALLFAYSTIFFVLEGVVGAYCFLIFIIPQAICLGLFFKFFPETKKKTVVEIMEDMGYKEPQRKMGLTHLDEVVLRKMSLSR